MTDKRPKAKLKKRKVPSDKLQVLKEHQKVLYLRQRRKARQRQMMIRRARGLLRLGLIIFSSLFVVYMMLIPQWNMNPLAFANYPNTDIVFKDNLLTKDSQLISQLKNIKIPDKPIYLINTEDYRQALKNIPSVKDVYIRRYWLPTRMIFTVTEKDPALLIYNDSNGFPVYAMTHDGTVLNKDFLPLPEIYKDRVFKIILPGNAKKPDRALIQKYFKIARIAEATTNEKLQYIDLRNASDIKLVMSINLIRLGAMDATIIERLSRLKVIMTPIETIQDKVEYIDLRWDKALSIKEKPEKKKPAPKPVSGEM